MGMYWKSILVHCDRDTIQSSLPQVQAMFTYLDKPINISLLTFQGKSDTSLLSLELVAFNNRPLNYSFPDPGLSALFSNSNQNITELFMKQIFRNRFEFHLLRLFSQVAGVAALIEYNDSLCSSGYFMARNGVFSDVEFYGVNGSELYLVLRREVFEKSIRDLSSFNKGYAEPLTNGLQLFLNRPANIEYLFSEFYSEKSTKTRFLLMQKKLLVKPVIIE